MKVRNTASSRYTRNVIERAKLRPPEGLVDVPKVPPTPTASTPDEAASTSRPVVDQREHSNWADGAAPRPRAKKARTSLL